MLDRSAFPGLDTQPQIVTFVPVSRLGVALAHLPEPWVVFRQNAFSPTDGVAGAIYGGVYIALHRDKGVALIDLAPAEPAVAIPGLRNVLRGAGLTPSTIETLPVVALTLKHDETGAIGERLATAFAAMRGEIAEAGWMERVIAALASRFPHLREVQRAGDDVAAPVAPREAAKVLPLAARAASSRAAEQAPAETRGATDRRASSPARRSTIAMSGAIFVLVVAALAALLLPLRDTSRETPTDVVATRPASVMPPLPATLSKPVTSTTTTAPAAPAAEPSSDAAPTPVTTPQSDDADTLSPDRFFALPGASHDAGSAAASTAPATAPPSPHATTTATIVPPSNPTRATAKPSAVKPEFTGPRIAPRVRHRRAATPPPPPVETVTIDGVTYVKGREPRSLGTVIGPTSPAGDTSESEGNATPNADATPDAGAAPNGGAAPVPGPATAPPVPLGPPPFAQH
jgi:hypothetical protein